MVVSSAMTVMIRGHAYKLTSDLTRLLFFIRKEKNFQNDILFMR